MRLIFTSGSRQGQAIDVDGARVMIGRVSDNDLQLEAEKVSRHHAVIERDESGRLVLRDLNSRNGTYVDGIRLSGPRVLTGGERLRLGDEHFLVQAEPAPAPPPGPAPAPARAPAPAPAPAPATNRRRPSRLAHIGKRRAFVAAGALTLLIAAAIAQFALPGVAEDSLRSDLSRFGSVGHVNVESFPAVKLLGHKADRVDVSMDSYRSEPGGHGSLAGFLSDTRSTGKLNARVGTLEAQLVTLSGVELHKDGDAVVGRAELTQRDLSDALPSFVGLRPIEASENGILVSASGSVLGKTARLRLQVLADKGRVVVRPDVPFGSLATIKVFNDPRVYVDSLGAQLRGNRYFLTARAHLK
jgi:hypothetical protein